jgi:hypothetical protein
VQCKGASVDHLPPSSSVIRRYVLQETTRANRNTAIAAIAAAAGSVYVSKNDPTLVGGSR